jgi:hypothetical protein
MNIGLYIENTGKQNIMQQLTSLVNKTILRNDIKDVSIFYDDVGYNPFDIKCGFFNSTDLWHFNGTLITTCIEATKNAINIVNNIDIIYLYDQSEKVNLFLLISMAQNSAIKIVCSDNDTAKQFYRLTNQKPYAISNLNNILNSIGA